MSPAGISKFFAYFFILAVVIQPTAVFGMPKTSSPNQNSSAAEQPLYAVALNSRTSSGVVLASRQAALSAPKFFSADVQLSVADFGDFYPELKIVVLDFSRVKISVVNQQTREVVLRVLPVSVLFYIGAAGREPFDRGILGMLAFAVAMDRPAAAKAGGKAAKEALIFGISSETPADFSSQSTLILRC